MFGLDTLLGAGAVIVAGALWRLLRAKRPRWAELIGSKVELFRRVFEMVELMAPKLNLREAEKLQLYLQRIREWSNALGFELSGDDYKAATLWAEQWAGEAKREPVERIAETLHRLRREAEDNLIALELASKERGSHG